MLFHGLNSLKAPAAPGLSLFSCASSGFGSRLHFVGAAQQETVAMVETVICSAISYLSNS